MCLQIQFVVKFNSLSLVFMLEKRSVPVPFLLDVVLKNRRVVASDSRDNDVPSICRLEECLSFAARSPSVYPASMCRRHGT